jgi:hypothetical protein
MQPVAALDRRLAPALPAWLLSGAFLAIIAVAAPILGGNARWLFIAGCGGIGVYAWVQGPASHLQACLTLFCFASLIRRIVDLRAGFDPSGVMLVGPLLAISAPVTTFAIDWRPAMRTVQILPLVIVLGCVLYAMFLTIFQGDWGNAASGSVKAIAPLIYGLGVISAGARREDMISAATSAFLVLLPAMGLYGLYQYVDPPEWDRYWMQSASILSAGLPERFGVRTFGSLNGPASFATFTTAGLTLVFFLRPGVLPVILALPAAIALMLSMYRTAWIALGVGIAFCLLFAATRGRATVVVLAIAAIIGMALLTPFGEGIGTRLESLANGVGDGSARERLDQFLALWLRPDSGMIGNGFVTVDVGNAGSMAIDGMFIVCWIAMGLIVGLICIAGLILAIGNAISAAWIDRSAPSIIIGALALEALIQLPLANIISGELGFLFWAFAILVPPMAPGAAPRSDGPP